MAPGLTGDEELMVEEVEPFGASSGEDARPPPLAPQHNGTVGRPKCLRDGIRRRHEVPDDLRYQAGIGQGATGVTLVFSKYSLGGYRVLDVKLLSTGAISHGHNRERFLQKLQRRSLAAYSRHRLRALCRQA
jgi:hypothetical protein